MGRKINTQICKLDRLSYPKPVILFACFFSSTFLFTQIKKAVVQSDYSVFLSFFLSIFLHPVSVENFWNVIKMKTIMFYIKYFLTFVYVIFVQRIEFHYKIISHFKY